MSRLLAGIAVIAVIATAIAGCGSTAGSSGASRTVPAAVKATPRLKRKLGAEISTLRAAQPKAPRIPGAPRIVHPPAVPEVDVPCFVAGSARCSEIPCREFAAAPAVLKTSSTVMTAPGGARRTVSPACPRAPRKLRVLVAGP